MIQVCRRLTGSFVSGCPVHGTRSTVLGTRFPVYGTQLPVHGTRFPVYGTRYRSDYGPPKLTPQEATAILSRNEVSHTMKSDSVLKFESNQLAANQPIEDRRSEAKCLLTSGTLFSVMDGHGGWSCAQALSERLLSYVAVGLLPANILTQYDDTVRKKGGSMPLLEVFKHAKDYPCEPLTDIHLESLHKFVLESLSVVDLQEEFIMEDTLKECFVRLDADFSREAKPEMSVNVESLEVAFSGSVCVLAHVDGPHLHVANVGDCRAVLGSQNEHTKKWQATPITVDHNCANDSEVRRIKNMHPHTESSFVLKNDRLLGQLAPLRAFGDMRYKWTLKELQDLMNLHISKFNHNIIPPNYFTPPYLIARPEVYYHRLTTRDKFLVLASDGLWDFLEPQRVVQLVGEHMAGLQTAEEFRPPGRMLTVGEISRMLMKRKAGLAMKPVDENCATHLIRNALGVEHRQLSAFLTFPQNIVRFYRDDITVTVIFFDSDYLRTCPLGS